MESKRHHRQTDRRDDEIVDRYLRAIEAHTTRGDGGVPPLLVDEFVSVARRFSDRRAISYGAWLDVGVAAEVLAEAGIVLRYATAHERLSAALGRSTACGSRIGPSQLSASSHASRRDLQN
jgi:hypothetical protein